MCSEKRRIGVVPIGEVPQITSKVIAANVLGCLNLEADILPPLEYPAYAYDEKRLQYDAGRILKALESLPYRDCEKVIGVLQVDLFIPVFTYVFGEARQGGKYALVSVFRLKRNSDGSASPKPLVLERAGKVALHELGHLYDLHHCMDERCLMHFSGELEVLDRTPLYFCRYCSVRVRDALAMVKRKGTFADGEK
jgi:archaemetzincin